MLQLISRAIVAKIILKPFRIRVHSKIARKPWAKLWYLCQALDLLGRGSVVGLPLADITSILDVGESTVWEWLRNGHKQGAFRSYHLEPDGFTIVLGGRNAVATALGLEDWGATIAVPLTEIRRLRKWATAGEVAAQQKKSYYAARSKLKNRERRDLKMPSAEQLIQKSESPSQKLAKGEIDSLIWVGTSKAFVNSAFVPYGASQPSIAEAVGVCDRTVRRHLAALNVDRRQICQHKPEYTAIAQAIDYESQVYHASDRVWLRKGDRGYHLHEANGAATSWRDGGHQIGRSRLFRYQGKDWLYRCNLYAVADFQLHSMRAARHQFLTKLHKPRAGEGEPILKVGTEQAQVGHFS